MKATEQYFPVVLFIMLHKVLLMFQCLDDILKCDHSNDSYWAVFSCGAVYYTLQGDSSIWVMDEILKLTIQMKASEQYFPVVLFLMLYEVVLAFDSVEEIVKCDHSNESYWGVLSCGAVYYAVRGGSNVLVFEFLRPWMIS